MKITNIFKRSSAALSAAVMTAALAAANFVPFSSTAAGELANDSVNQDKNGILQVEVWYHPTGMEDICIQTGSTFLINKSTLLTCAHVFDIEADTKNWIVDHYTTDAANPHQFDDDYLHYEIAILGDNKKPATIKEKSAESDYAVLSIDTDLSTKVPLWLGDSDEISQTQDVYALGFPAAVQDTQQYTSYTPYTAADVTVTKGSVSKTGFVFDDGKKVTTNLIQHNATISGGNSGGPLVDANGVVIGINASIGIRDGFSYAIEINKVKELLDLLSIPYNEGSEPIPTTTTLSPDPDPVTTETVSITTLQPQTSENGAGNTEDDDDNDNDDKDYLPLIIGIIAAAVIIIILILILLLKGKKKPVQPAAAPQQPPMPPMGGAPMGMPQQPQRVQPQYPSAPTAPSDMGAGETSLLGAGAGETSVLNNGGVAVGRATLTRKRNGTTVPINAPEFIIGKESSKVNFCVSNNAVSRKHARITINNGNYYITDLNSSNFTYINGRQIPALQPQMLHNGDVIKLADEEFEFRG